MRIFFICFPRFTKTSQVVGMENSETLWEEAWGFVQPNKKDSPHRLQGVFSNRDAIIRLN